MPTSELTRTELVRAFVDLGALLNGPKSIDERMTGLCAATAKILRCDQVAMVLLEGNEYRGKWQIGLPDLLGQHYDKYTVSRDRKTVIDIEACDTYLLYNEVQSHPVLGRVAKISDVASVIIVPFRMPDGSPLGYITAGYREDKHHLSERDAEITMGLASLATTTVLRYFESERRREISQAMLDVADSERRRLSRDIHDDPLQRILGLRVGLEAFRRQIDDTDLLETVDGFIEQCRGASASLREVMLRTHPNASELSDLEDVVKQMAAQREFGANPQVEFVDNRSSESPSYLVPAINRIAEQAARNTLRHANASVLRITLDEVGGGTRLVVEDDGRGFDPSVVDRTRLGLVSMRERTELLRGTFTINSQRGTGTTVTAWFPHTEADPLPSSGPLPPTSVRRSSSEAVDTRHESPS